MSITSIWNASAVLCQDMTLFSVVGPLYAVHNHHSFFLFHVIMFTCRPIIFVGHAVLLTCHYAGFV